MKIFNKKFIKKTLITGICGILMLGGLTACGESAGFDAENEIIVISREAGSGTRGAFVELFGIEEEDADGNKVDKTVNTADINDSTGIVLTNVAGSTYAIGYISLGALNDTVKAVQINGVDATAENIKNGTYTAARPFNIAVKDEVSEVTQDFIDFILSTEGQAVIEEEGYIPLENVEAYAGEKVSGNIVIAGSSSVTPVMEKLKEAYLAINTNAAIEIQQSDSTSGMLGAIEGICDIGMASRDLKDSEIEQGLTPIEIAIDGIAVIVNNENPVSDLTTEEVKAIYTGESVLWSEVQ